MCAVFYTMLSCLFCHVELPEKQKCHNLNRISTGGLGLRFKGSLFSLISIHLFFSKSVMWHWAKVINMLLFHCLFVLGSLSDPPTPPPAPLTVPPAQRGVGYGMEDSKRGEGKSGRLELAPHTRGALRGGGPAPGGLCPARVRDHGGKGTWQLCFLLALRRRPN